MAEITKSEMISPESMGTYMGELMSSVTDLNEALRIIKDCVYTPLANDYESGGGASNYYGEAIGELYQYAASLYMNVERLICLETTLYQYMAANVKEAQLTDKDMAELINSELTAMGMENIEVVYE